MRTVAGILRGALALAGVSLLFAGLDLYQRSWLALRLRRASEADRHALVGRHMRLVAHRVLALARLAGARFDLRGTVPSDGPALVVMNHQSLLDIPVATAMAAPRALRFVSRSVYARGVPLVSGLLRISDGVIVDPDHAPRTAVRALARAAESLESALLIFPEGERTRDGSLARFRSAGLKALLRARRLPVYLLVLDGAWACRTLLDVVSHAHRIRVRAEVLGPFEPPAAARELTRFIAGLEARTRERLQALREEVAGG